VQLHHYRIDESHSNAFAAWQKMGSPQQPTPEQYAELAVAGQLTLLDSPSWLKLPDGKAEIQLTLPAHAVSLLRLTW
jgi:xylan 1,4-beta-xylosidase